MTIDAYVTLEYPNLLFHITSYQPSEAMLKQLLM